MNRTLCLFLLLCTGCESSTPLSDAGPGFSFVSSIRFTSATGTEGSYMRVRLTARCDGPWEFGRLRIMDGHLPSGIVFDGEEFSGVPAQQGNYLVQARIVDPQCNGVVYNDKDVWVRFSIRGDRIKR